MLLVTCREFRGGSFICSDRVLGLFFERWRLVGIEGRVKFKLF